jgi:inosine/guanosine/xanthosine phosphorylase family protein
MRAEPNPEKAAARIRKLSPLRPTLALVLGSGFRDVSGQLTETRRLPYSSLPGFPPVGISGHAGELYVGRLGGTPVIVLGGRAHFYEGLSMGRVTFPVRVLAHCGIKDLLLTSAAGGINPAFRPGHFMALTDHINLMGANPLRGAPPDGRERFVDLTQVYDPVLLKLLLAAGRACNSKMRRGVYLAVSGPSYETPSEIKAFARLGADAVGMSMVPEAVVARQYGLRVAGMSCITNLAAGLGCGTLSHTEVLDTAGLNVKLAIKLLLEFAELYGKVAERTSGRR